MLKRIISVLTVMAIMAAMLAAGAMPAFAQAQQSEGCVEDVVNAADVLGDLCTKTVLTPSGNRNTHGHFRPDEGPNGGSVEQGAEKNLDQFCGLSGTAPCNVVFTPSGNVHGTWHTHPAG